MSARYEITKTVEDRYYFELRSGTTMPLLTGNPCSALSTCRGNIASLRIICDAPFDDGTQNLSAPKYFIERTKYGLFCLSLLARNGRVIARGPACASARVAAGSLDVIRREARYAPVTEKIRGT